MFSGGEPSIHPQILEFCAMARDKGVRTVVLNTNGIRLAHDRSFAPALAELDVRIYLQFDGLDEATHLALRGRDLRNAKAQALDRCADAGLTVLLVAAATIALTARLQPSSTAGAATATTTTATTTATTASSRWRPGT